MRPVGNYAGPSVRQPSVSQRRALLLIVVQHQTCAEALNAYLATDRQVRVAAALCGSARSIGGVHRSPPEATQAATRRFGDPLDHRDASHGAGRVSDTANRTSVGHVVHPSAKRRRTLRLFGGGRELDTLGRRIGRTLHSKRASDVRLSVQSKCNVRKFFEHFLQFLQVL